MPVTRLKVLRVQRGLKLIEAAQALGIHFTKLSQIENGRSWVPPALREKLADFFHVGIGEICDLETGWPILYDRPKPAIVRR
ncbi:MAG: helix-turn-helix domain-containing protein [Moorellaceae bacterium]